MAEVLEDGRAIWVPDPKPLTKKEPFNGVVIPRTAFTDSVRWQLQAMEGGEPTAVEFLRTLQYEPDADDRLKLVVKRWDELLSASHGRKVPSLDAICRELEMSPSKIFGWLAEATFKQGLYVGKFIAGMALPGLMQASLTRALEPDNEAERKLHLTALGYLPERGRPSVAVQVNNNPPALPPDPTVNPVNTTQSFSERSRHAANVLRNRRKELLPAARIIEGETIDSPKDVDVLAQNHQP